MANIGQRSGQAGNAVPLLGESEIRVISTGVNALTITGSTNIDAPFLVARSNAPAGSTEPSLERFVLSSGGGLSKIGSSNVAISTAGVVKGFRRTTYEISSAATTGWALGSTMSGGFIKVGPWTSAATLTLPTLADGMEFVLFIPSSANAGTLTIRPASTAATFIGLGCTTGADAIVGPGTTGNEAGNMLWLVADSSNWFVNMFPAGTTAPLASAVGWAVAS